jgi:putative oxidoreductase
LLVRFGIIDLTGASFSLSTIPQIVGACLAILLLVGLWTPVVGTMIAVIELWVALNHAADPWIPIILATFGGTAAMIGPGAWSIDARLFGRKHIET